MIFRKANRTFLFLSAIILLITGYSCSTKKNTFTRRVFHNITGHYNMYWNGRESFREGVVQLEQKVEDNYNKILPVYNYGTEDIAQSIGPYMDKAIEKASFNIQDHSMYFKRKEHVRWIDDSYMLIGLGYFYKQEYNKARRTFEFVMTEYKNSETRYEAMLWLCKSYNQLGKYKRAQSAMDNLQNEIDKNNNVPGSVTSALPLVRANMYILQEKYSQAKDHLMDGLFQRQKKSLDARTRFILAQIYQSEEETYKASQYYRQVIKRNPQYEMVFNAAMNLASSYDTLYNENSKVIIKKLKKMLKEDKNLEFKDQIYYALADISFKDGIDTLAINYLKLSVATSVSNNYQKATSSLMLGDLYFDNQEYELAQAYYDTAVQTLPEDFPDGKNIILRTSYLTELVENLIVIKTEDSLQMLAGLSEDERNVIIDKLIEEYNKAEEEKQREMERQQMMGQNMNMDRGESNTMNTTGNRGAWYFYNPSAISFGFSEFKKKWGNRKLEDNWRLSNKKAVFDYSDDNQLADADSLATDSSTVVQKTDPRTRDYYLKDIPLTEEQILSSDVKIHDALYNLGFIYKDKLDNNPKSAESFEILVERFPETDHLLLVYYQLFRLYAKLDNPDQSEHYKNLLIKTFPESDYARILLDPDYYKELEAQKNKAITLYNETYDHYVEGHYYTVYSNSTRALAEFEEPPELLAKFEYLRALSLGKIEVVDSLQSALEVLVQKYPDKEVTVLAQNILDYLQAPIDSTASVEPEEVFDVSIYEHKPESRQLFALVVSDKDVNINALKVRISDFNTKYYGLENLSITNILLDATTHFVMVGNFKLIDNAMSYYNALMTNEYVFANLNLTDYAGFVIAQENYPVFYKDKDLDKYLAFFKQNYLGE